MIHTFNVHFFGPFWNVFVSYIDTHGPICFCKAREAGTSFRAVLKMVWFNQLAAWHVGLPEKCAQHG